MTLDNARKCVGRVVVVRRSDGGTVEVPALVRAVYAHGVRVQFAAGNERTVSEAHLANAPQWQIDDFLFMRAHQARG